MTMSLTPTQPETPSAAVYVRHIVKLAGMWLPEKKWMAVAYFLAFFVAPVAVWAECRAANTGAGIDDMTYVMCYMACVMYSGVGRAIAVMGVIVLGLGATFGKVSWGLALTVAVGVTTIFGAPKIIQAITGFNILCKDTWGAYMAP